MSNFIVNSRCVNDVITLLKNNITYLMEVDNDILFERIVKLNSKAYNELYNDTFNMLPNVSFKESERHELTMFRNLGCLIYQCSVGSVTKDDFYLSLCFYYKWLLAKFFAKYISDNPKTYEFVSDEDLEHYMVDKILNYMDKHKIERRWGN